MPFGGRKQTALSCANRLLTSRRRRYAGVRLSSKTHNSSNSVETAAHDTLKAWQVPRVSSLGFLVVAVAVVPIVRITIGEGVLTYLVQNHPNDIGSQPIQHRDHLCNGLTPGFSCLADNEDSVGGGSHLKALRESQQRRRIKNDQIKFLREFVQKCGKSRADQISCPMRAKSSRQEAQVGSSLDGENDIPPSEFPSQNIGQPLPRSEPKF